MVKFQLNWRLRLRQEFDIADLAVNSLHGASTPEQAEKEISKFFPNEYTVGLLKPGLTAEQKGEFFGFVLMFY